jgi:RNA polymerase sigma-70 factor (ECF subfamily)
MAVGVDEFKQLFVTLRRVLYSRGQGRDDTDDLIQEAFLRLQHYHTERTVNHTEAFLVRTVLNLLTDQHRKKQTACMVHGALDAFTLVDPSPPPEAVCDGQGRLRHFKAGLRELSPRQREVFILNRIEGYSFAQIAQRLGITISMAEKHAARAMFFLVDWMDRHEDGGKAGEE